MDERIAPQYIRENFQSSDRLAVVLLNKRTGAVTQRIGAADRIAAPQFQAWLRYENAQGRDIYISMNALKSDARHRTKNDIGAVRHIFLDFDRDGEASVHRLLDLELPVPNYVVDTSPDKKHVVWRVEGFAKDEAENLQRNLARVAGADSAATDCARVLRLPGFYNHKYEPPYPVRVGSSHTEITPAIYRREDFPYFTYLTPTVEAERKSGRPKTDTGLSQSERDWAYAKRALARGESPEAIITTLANYRRFDKHNPQYYAELTVRKAVESLKAVPAARRPEEAEPGTRPEPTPDIGPER